VTATVALDPEDTKCKAVQSVPTVGSENHYTVQHNMTRMPKASHIGSQVAY